jgi:hypothetical protein
MKCNWCLVDLNEFDERVITDSLVLHSNNANNVRPMTCAQMYRNYTRHISRMQGFIGADTWSVGKYER